MMQLQQSSESGPLAGYPISESHHRSETTALESLYPPDIAALKAVLAAVLIQLIKDLRLEGATAHYVGDKKIEFQIQLAEKAKVYIEENNMEPFSFLWLCEQLDVDSEWFRQEVRTDRIWHWQPVRQTLGDWSFTLQHA